MGIQFTKMHGLGNDFIVIDSLSQTINLSSLPISTLSRRDIGVGFDQCLLVEASNQPGIDFYYRIFNANGQEVGQCGNGARCLALFLKYSGLTDKNLITVATSTTQMQLQINGDNTVTVNMGIPKFKSTEIPIATTEEAPYVIPLQNQETCLLHTVNVGNPHAVLLVTSVDEAPVVNIGQAISEHVIFPEQANVGFMQILTPQHIQLRVYERGCGETQACGSGAVAAAVIGRQFHHLQENVTVSLPGGDLNVSWAGTNQSVFLTGPATFVYQGILL